MYEPHRHPLLSRSAFIERMLRHGLLALLLVSISLAAGIAGYMTLEKLPWPDAFLDTTMLLGGMGPVHPPHTLAGKLFAGCFALYAGLLFLVVASLLVAPVLHRLLHRFHLEHEQPDR